MPVELRIKQVREARGLSQYELAQRTNMSPQNIQKLEQGRAKGIQLDTLDILCEALQCDVQDLLVRVEAEPTASDAISPSRRRKPTATPPQEKSEFHQGQMVRNPAGWRGWITKLLDDGKAIVDWEGQVNGDVIPLHLLTACE